MGRKISSRSMRQFMGVANGQEIDEAIAAIDPFLANTSKMRGATRHEQMLAHKKHTF